VWIVCLGGPLSHFLQKLSAFGGMEVGEIIGGVKLSAATFSLEEVVVVVGILLIAFEVLWNVVPHETEAVSCTPVGTSGVELKIFLMCRCSGRDWSSSSRIFLWAVCKSILRRSITLLSFLETLLATKPSRFESCTPNHSNGE